MKTINDIVREIATEMLNTSMQDITAERIHGWATRLGEVATCKESLQVGNGVKMREAIAECVNLITKFGNAEIVKTPLDVIIDIEAMLDAALAEPLRNCDVCRNTHEAVRRFVAERNPIKLSFEEFAFWLFKKAKGDVK